MTNFFIGDTIQKSDSETWYHKQQKFYISNSMILLYYKPDNILYLYETSLIDLYNKI